MCMDELKTSIGVFSFVSQTCLPTRFSWEFAILYTKSKSVRMANTERSVRPLVCIGLSQKGSSHVNTDAALWLLKLHSHWHAGDAHLGASVQAWNTAAFKAAVLQRYPSYFSNTTSTRVMLWSWLLPNKTDKKQAKGRNILCWLMGLVI